MDKRPFFTDAEWGALWLCVGLIVLFVVAMYALSPTCDSIPISRACFTGGR